MTPQEKRRVRSKAQHALVRGQLVKQPCSVCGITERVEAHHPKGYESPHELDVEWLCKKHHSVVHMKIVPEAELLAALRKAGSATNAAELLGVSRKTVYRWTQFYGIKRTYQEAA